MFAALIATAASMQSAAQQKHVIAILADDYGWADAGWHRPEGYQEVQTPNLDALVKDGVELDRHYVFKFCAPTRAAAQTGRNPIHVNTVNTDPNNYNPADPVSGMSGVPRNMTGVAELMRSAGYATHFAGKWDCGMATPRHTPRGRGYDTSVHYFHHMEDYWPETCHPYPGFPNEQQEGCTYVDETFTKFVLDTIEAHVPSKPLFLFWAPHIVHSPLQVPKVYYDAFAHIDDWRRRRYHAMVNYMDSRVGLVINLLKSKDMYDDSAIFFSADNGGPIYSSGSAGANNYPLKGGKASNWEGGIRVNAFASGGAIPTSLKGQKFTGLSTIWDWYATFTKGIAGVKDIADKAAAEAKLPPIDSLNLWPYLTGDAATSPRQQVVVGTGNGDVNGILVQNGTHLWKRLEGSITMAGWTAPQSPNSTFETPGVQKCEPYCLYDVLADPSEYSNLVNDTSTETVALELKTKMVAAGSTGFRPDRGPQDPQSCLTAMEKYGGWWGPWVSI